MAMYRFTILFKTTGPEPVGHSERWDFDLASDSAATDLAKTLASRRAQFMPLGWVVQAVRVGKLTAFHTVSHGWRFKQTAVHVCIPPTFNGSGVAEWTGGAVYYRFQYNGGSGRPAIRLFVPVPNAWFNGSTTGPNAIKNQADGEIQPFSRWLKAQGHKLMTIDKTSGSTNEFDLSCVTFQRSAVKKVGRPFFLRRGRRFAHRTPRP